MRDRIIIAGFGGQGVMLLGQLLAYAAVDKDLYTTWVPSYGPETRGGTANCQVIVSDKEIYSPVFSDCEFGIFMNGPSLEKFKDEINPGGVVFINSDLVENTITRDDVKVYEIPCNTIAIEIGLEKAANMVMLGAFIEQAHDFFVEEDIVEVLQHLFGEGKAHFIDVNTKAIERGIEFIKTHD